MSYYVVLVGTYDNPLYETFLTNPRAESSKAFASKDAPGKSFSLLDEAINRPGRTTTKTGTHSNVSYDNPNALDKDSRYLAQLVAHASLDVIEDVQWVQSSMYLRDIDSFHGWNVSAWVTPGAIKIIILHESPSNEGIRHFLQGVWESYVKTLLNPFYALNAPIVSPMFDERVRQSAARYL